MRPSILLVLLLLPLAHADLEAEAERVLWQNSYPAGILAGSTHFSDVWARDALYASWGATAAHMYGPVRGTLNTLARHQSPQGQIPLRVGSTSIVRKLLGLPAGYGPVYTNDKSSEPALDANCLYVITLERYVNASNDQSLLEEHRWHAQKAIEWLDTRRGGDDRELRDKPLPAEYHLLSEGPYASWDDALKKNGASIYSNACYHGALRAAARLTRNQSYEEQADEVRAAINDLLFNGAYYKAWEGRDVLDVPGNLLAIEWGVANASQAESILASLAEEKAARGHALPKLNYPSYKMRDVYTPFYLINMADYHNSGPWWSWVAALEAKIREDNGQHVEAALIRGELERWVETSGSIHETYQAPGEPLDRLFYNSEKDFSWTAGIILYSGSSLSRSQ